MASNAFLPCCHRAVTVAPIIDVSAAETREVLMASMRFFPVATERIGGAARPTSWVSVR